MTSSSDTSSEEPANEVSRGLVRIALFDIALPRGDTAVRAERVWTAIVDTDHRVCCGATVVEDARDTWRQFVDSVRVSESASL